MSMKVDVIYVKIVDLVNIVVKIKNKMTNFVSRFNDDTAFLEIIGDSKDKRKFLVEFIDLNTNLVEYSTIIKVNFFAQITDISNKNILIKVISKSIRRKELRKRYFISNDIVYQKRQDQKFNRVYIKFGSNAIGDSISWIPCVEEYRKINNVEVILYTNYNYLFDKVYPDIKFTKINDSNLFDDVDKKFRIDYGPELFRINGKSAPEEWAIQNKKYDNAVSYFDYRKNSLQSIGKLILGLTTAEELIPKINIPIDGPNIKCKYVVVAIQSTAQLKYWNNPFGWKTLFDFLGQNGYKIVLIDRFKNFGVFGHYNQAPKSKYVIDKSGNYPLSDRIIDIKYAEMMITISSGLAWMSWSIGTPVVMISGFTKPWNEFQSNVIRVHNSTVCNGCWNDPNVTYDAENWLFCPKNKDFICSKVIQPKDVIDAVKKLIK